MATQGPPRHLSVRQAAFIGVGAMVGATAVALLVILLLSIVLDVRWKRHRDAGLVPA